MTPSNPSYRGYVYLIGSSRFGWYKIGKSRSATIRVQTLGILLPFKVEVFAVWMTDNPSGLETSLHEKYSDFHVNGEWFSFTWGQLCDVIDDESPIHSVKLSNNEPLCSFSNISHDRIRKAKRSRVDGLGFMEWVNKVVQDRNIEPTKENIKPIKDEVGKLFRLRA